MFAGKQKRKYKPKSADQKVRGHGSKYKNRYDIGRVVYYLITIFWGN